MVLQAFQNTVLVYDGLDIELEIPPTALIPTLLHFHLIPVLIGQNGNFVLLLTLSVITFLTHYYLCLVLPYLSQSKLVVSTITSRRNLKRILMMSDEHIEVPSKYEKNHFYDVELVLVIGLPVVSVPGTRYSGECRKHILLLFFHSNQSTYEYSHMVTYIG